MKTKLLSYDTTDRQVTDLTGDVVAFVQTLGDGFVNVFVPHATAGVAIVETGSGTEPDLLAAIDRLLPRDDRYAHRHGSPGHGADHVLPAFVSPSVVVPVIAREPALGTWQSIVLVDTNRDNPRRQVRLSFLASP
ncbi:MAG TPA: YjbQ family protein [Actinomycetota bacterium]|nr:YjbQ family protein [Actinomycetota bacterium]